MDKTFVFLDAGFLSKLSKHFGKGKYLKYNITTFANYLAKKENLECQKIFYYTAPPFQSEKPSQDEISRRERYDKFIKKLSQNKDITIREGRCQRLRIDGKFIYKQKAVDSLMIIDLMSLLTEYNKIKKIILVATDSDFVPAIKYLKRSDKETILYTHYTKKRNTGFSRSNELLKTADKYAEIKKEDFENAPLTEEKKENRK